jgi:energy-coupling factor transport system ATP-binding protein
MTSSAVELQDVTFTFAGRDQPSLRGVSCALPPASWTLVAGRTGSGKSTLLRAMAGLIPRHTAGRMEGRVRLFGEDTANLSPGGLASRVGLVLQSPDDQLCATTVSAEVAFGLENACMPPVEIGPRVAEALARVELAELADRPVAPLSGGQKQRLAVAAVLAMRPRLVVLDEPLSQLDPESAADLLATLDELRRQGLTIVVAEHRLDDCLPRADRVLVLDGGSLAASVGRDERRRLSAALETAGLDPPDVARLSSLAGFGPLWTADEVVAVVQSGRDGSVPAPSPEPAPSGASAERNSAQAPVTRVAGFAVRHRGAAAPVFRDVSFDLHEGECVALVGPNGAGKSTLLAALAGLWKPAAGRIEMAPAPAGVVPAGLVLQNPDLMLFCRTVAEELAFGPQQIGLPAGEAADRARAAAAACGLVSRWEENPQSLSQGERLRTALAATLALAPRMLLFDEPTSGQDPRQVSAVMEAVVALVCCRGATAAVLFSTHDLRTVVRWSDRVLVLADGRLLADLPPSELLADDRLLAAARLRRPPVWEVRRRLALAGTTVEVMAEELRRW